MSLYIRTNNGIFKDKLPSKDFIKSSSRIMDVIEKGDYINNEKVITIFDNKEGERYGIGVWGKAVVYWDDKRIEPLLSKIVTKEQLMKGGE